MRGSEPAADPDDRAARIDRVVERSRRARRGVIAIAIVVGAFYAWDLIEAVGNLVALVQYADLVGGSLNSFAWLVLGTGIAIPPIVYAGAFLIGRGRGRLRFGVVLAAGLGVVACLSLVMERLLSA